MNSQILYNSKIASSSYAIITTQKMPPIVNKLTDTHKMYKSVERLVEKNLSTSLLSLEFREAFVIFKLKMGEIQVVLDEEDALNNAITAKDFESRDKICKAGADIALLLFRCTKSNSVSMPKFELFYNDFYRMKPNILEEKMYAVHEEANKNIHQLTKYGITPSLLKAFQAMVSDYFKPNNLKQTAALKKRNLRNLRLLFRDADSILKDQLDKSVTKLKKSNPQFVFAYRSKRIVE